MKTKQEELHTRIKSAINELSLESELGDLPDFVLADIAMDALERAAETARVARSFKRTPLPDDIPHYSELRGILSGNTQC